MDSDEEEDDDDEEDVSRSADPLMSRDVVRDCLEKDPMDRTDDDIGKHPQMLKSNRNTAGRVKLPYRELFRNRGVLQLTYTTGFLYGFRFLCVCALQSSYWSSCSSCQPLPT